MQKPVIAGVDGKLLESKTADSARFVYSNYVMPLLITSGDDVTPILPGYKREMLNAFARAGVINGPQIREALPALGLGELLSFNGLEIPDAPPAPGTVTGGGEPIRSEALGRLDYVGELLEMVDANLSRTDRVVTRAARTELREARTALADGRFDRRPPHPVPEQPTPPTREEMIQFFIGLLKSDIAYFFLDRTRIQPSSFHIGEHVYALSLAPGEEVTLEQKTFTKRQMTYEEQNDTETELNLELASTLSTEIQEGFEQQKTLTDTWGLAVSHSGQYSSPIISDVAYGSFNANHSLSYTTNVTNADQETRHRATKDSQVVSSKVAAKYRTEHKTVFKVSAEQGFESVAKRVIRNPNPLTPITLHFFKILQQIDLTYERYGVRLGWAPSIKDPAYGFFEQITAGRDKILSDAEAALPRKPEPPAAGGDGNGGGAQAAQPKWSSSEVLDAGTGAADGSMSGDFPVDVPLDDGYEWDGTTDSIDIASVGDRPKEMFSRDVKGRPTVVMNTGGGSALRVVVHIGAGADAFRRRMIQIQVNVLLVPKRDQAPASDPQADQELAAYQMAVRDWEATCDRLRDDAHSAAGEWEQTMMRNLNPVVEMVNQLIKNSFPPNVRDEGWEIDLWQQLFDWQRASYVPYPGWWADGPLRDPTRDPADFVNASWAHLYLPIRVGMERLALRWIHGRSTKQLDARTEARFDDIEADLKKYREERFGDPTETMDPAADGFYQEKFDKIASWTDLMPTDGTHIEVVQAYSMAADELTLRQARDAAELRGAVIASHDQDAKLKKKAVDKMSQPASVEVTIAPFGAVDGTS
jgi:hypothetical protein